MTLENSLTPRLAQRHRSPRERRQLLPRQSNWLWLAGIRGHGVLSVEFLDATKRFGISSGLDGLEKISATRSIAGGASGKASSFVVFRWQRFLENRTIKARIDEPEKMPDSLETADSYGVST